MPSPDAAPDRSWAMRISEVLLWVPAAAGTAVAVYLVYVHYQETALVCGLGDCEKVQTSTYAVFAGIPIAWFGLALYLGIVGLLAARHWHLIDADIADVLLVGATFAGTLAVAYLTYLEIWVIDAICQWCVAFAIITMILFLLAVLQLRRTFAGTDD